MPIGEGFEDMKALRVPVGDGFRRESSEGSLGEGFEEMKALIEPVGKSSRRRESSEGTPV